MIVPRCEGCRVVALMAAEVHRLMSDGLRFLVGSPLALAGVLEQVDRPGAGTNIVEEL